MRFARRNLCQRRAHGAQAVRNLIGLCFALFLALFCVGGPAVADDVRTNRMQIEYVPPKNPAFQPSTMRSSSIKRSKNCSKSSARFGCQLT